MVAKLTSFNVHEGAKSHAGIYITFGGGGVLCKSYKIKIVPKSVDEAGVCERNFSFTKNDLGSTARIFVFFG